MSVHLSVHTRGGGGTPARSRWGRVPQPGPGGGIPLPRGVPWQTWLGVPWWGGVPHLSDLAGGYPDGGTPPRVTPLLDLAGGGTPPQVHPCQTWPGGGYPNRGGGVPHLGSTWYATVGMPLAFTQEDFLVLKSKLNYWSASVCININYIMRLKWTASSWPFFPPFLFCGD